MDKDKKEWEKKAKCVYVPPQIEVYEAVPGRLLGTSFWGTHADGDENYGDNDHAPGNLNPVESGAKAVILGQDFSFSDLWEE